MIQSCDKNEYRNKNAINYDKIDILYIDTADESRQISRPTSVWVRR